MNQRNPKKMNSMTLISNYKGKQRIRGLQVPYMVVTGSTEKKKAKGLAPIPMVLHM